MSEIAGGGDNLLFDLSGDGVVNSADLTKWLTSAVDVNRFADPYLMGDANLDGTVNALDLNALALNWQQDVARWSAGDFNADGMVNAADLNALALNWRRSIPVAASDVAVPEPLGFLLAALCLILVGHRMRRGA